MKRCEYCRSYVKDDELKCPNCGAYVVDVPPIQPSNVKTENKLESVVPSNASEKVDKPDILLRLALVFLIIRIVLACASGPFVISLFWAVPITLSLRKKIYRGEHISLGRKIVVLIFGSIVAGVLLLCYGETDGTKIY